MPPNVKPTTAGQADSTTEEDAKTLAPNQVDTSIADETNDEAIEESQRSPMNPTGSHGDHDGDTGRRDRSMADQNANEREHRAASREKKKTSTQLERETQPTRLRHEEWGMLTPKPVNGKTTLNVLHEELMASRPRVDKSKWVSTDAQEARRRTDGVRRSESSTSSSTKAVTKTVQTDTCLTSSEPTFPSNRTSTVEDDQWLADTPREGGTPQPIVPTKQCIIDFKGTSKMKEMYEKVHLAEESAKAQKTLLDNAIQQYSDMVEADKKQRQKNTEDATEDATDDEVDGEATPPERPSPRKKMSEDDRRDRKAKMKERRRAEKKDFDEFQKTRRERRRNATRKPHPTSPKERRPKRRSRRSARRGYSSSGSSSGTTTDTEPEGDEPDKPKKDPDSDPDSDSDSNSSSTDTTDSNSDRRRTHKGKRRQKGKESPPNFTNCEKIARQLPKLTIAREFGDWERKFKNMSVIVGWPKWIFDARAPVFTMNQRETAQQKKRRFECFLVMQQCVGKEHEDKWQFIIDGAIKADAQALFRKIVKVFSLTGTFGSVIEARNALQKCSMASTGLRVEAYGIEFVKRVKAVLECGGEVNEMIELVPMFLAGIPSVFKTYIEEIENSIDAKEETYSSLHDVIDRINFMANRKKLTNVRAMSQSNAAKVMKNNAAQVQPKCYSCGGPHYKGDKTCANYLSPEEYKKKNPQSKRACKYGDKCRNISKCSFDHSKDAQAKKSNFKGGSGAQRKAKRSFAQQVKDVKLGLQSVVINGKTQEIDVQADNVLNLAQTITGQEEASGDDGIFIEAELDEKYDSGAETEEWFTNADDVDLTRIQALSDEVEQVPMYLRGVRRWDKDDIAAHDQDMPDLVMDSEPDSDDPDTSEQDDESEQEDSDGPDIADSDDESDKECDQTREACHWKDLKRWDEPARDEQDAADDCVCEHCTILLSKLAHSKETVRLEEMLQDRYSRQLGEKRTDMLLGREKTDAWFRTSRGRINPYGMMYEADHYDCKKCWEASIQRVSYLHSVHTGKREHPSFDMDKFHKEFELDADQYDKFMDVSITGWSCWECDQELKCAAQTFDIREGHKAVHKKVLGDWNREQRTQAKARRRKASAQHKLLMKQKQNVLSKAPTKGRAVEAYYRPHIKKILTQKREKAWRGEKRWRTKNIKSWEPDHRRIVREWAGQSVIRRSVWRHFYRREDRVFATSINLENDNDWMTNWEVQVTVNTHKEERKARKRFTRMQWQARRIDAWRRRMFPILKQVAEIAGQRLAKSKCVRGSKPVRKVVDVNRHTLVTVQKQRIAECEKEILRLNRIQSYPLLLQSTATLSGEMDETPIIDSGAMVHSVKDNIPLSNKKTVTNMMIAGIHGPGQPIKTKGTWKLKSAIPKTKLNIKDVYVVPKASVNLLSVGKFDDLGLTSTFKDGKCSVSDRRGVTILSGVKVDGLYRVQERQEVSALAGNIMNYDTSCLLRDHERLGHRAFSTVRKLMNYPSASRECLDPVCESCQYAQMRNKGIPKEALSRAPRYAYRLCSDTSNKKPTTNAEGKTGLQRYALTVDEHTGTMHVDFNQRKANAKFSVIDLIDRINSERQVDKVAEHQSDGGTEWLNKKMNKMLAQRGVKPRNSSPYCQYQNGVAESAMEYVEKTQKAMILRGSAPATDWPYAVRHAVHLHDVLPNAVTMLSPYELRNGMSPRETAENIKGVIFCLCYAKLCNAGKYEHKAIKCVYLGKDPKSQGSLVRPIGGKLEGKRIRVAQVVNFDITNFPYTNPQVPRPDALAEVVYQSDSDSEADRVHKKKKADDAKKTKIKKVVVVDVVPSDSDDEAEPEQPMEEEKSQQNAEEESSANVDSQPEGWIPGGKIGDEDAYEIEKIVAMRMNKKTKRRFKEYQIKWKGDWPLEWVPESSIQAPELVADFLSRKKFIDKGNGFVVRVYHQEAKLTEGGTEYVQEEEFTINPYKKLFDPVGTDARPLDPKGFQRMLKHKHADYFIEASNKEKVENKKWKAYIEVPRHSVPKGTRILKPVTVYTHKYNDKGEIEKFKCRVCLDGSRTDVDPKETYEAMCSFSTIRLLFCIATRFKLHLVQTDIKNFYLQARLPAGKEYYAEIPDGWAEGNPKHFVAKVLAPWYGLREASKVAGDQFAAVMEKYGMKENKWMPKLFTQWVGDDFLMCAQWSDDGIWATTNIALLDKILDKVHSDFALVRNYKPAKMLGSQIEYDRSRGILKLHQGEYWKAKIKELQIPHKTARSPGIIPQKIPNPLFEDKKVQASEESIRTFQRHVGVHIWGLQTDASAAFVTTKLASGMVNPQKLHWDILARLEAYKTTYPEMGIVFRAADPPEVLKKGHNLDCLSIFADADLAGDLTDSKSTSGYSCHLGESGMFDWKCKKQTCVCQSSCESETLSSKLATCTAIWLRNGLADMGFTFTRPTPVCQDNQSAIALCESDKHHSRTRHFRMHVHFLKDCQAKRITCYPWVPTAHMRGDMFNKMHGPIMHERLLEMNQMSPHPIHALEAKPKPMVVYGWIERHAQEKAEAAEKAVEADSNAHRSKKNLK